MTTAWSDALLNAAEYHAAWGAEQLETLGVFVPAGPWTADLTTRVFCRGGREFTFAVLGTFDTVERSWLWGWANPGLQGTPAADVAERARAVGLRYGIPEFGDGFLDLAGFADPRHAAETLAFAAMGVTGSPGYLGVEAGPTTRLYLVPDDPQVPRAVPDPVTVPRYLMTGAGLFGRSARTAVTGYLDHHGLPRQEWPDRLRAALPGGSGLTVDFDPIGRIGSIHLDAIAPTA
ncbi:DUF6882 domain-containing protein [Kitasatospora sp. NPDC059571]|uniref:DUF6882 domain-containing protein n=1 Tax=Kitasatospora sp. NPDC059571 TaxID=3346871 RepID=UPI00367EE4AF